MDEINIWDNLDLSNDNLKTAYDYLQSQVENFKSATHDILNMQIETTYGSTGDPDSQKVTLYSVYIVAPHLGNFRKKILHVGEYTERGRFPVLIYSHILESAVKDVGEEEFLIEIKKVMETNLVKGAVENLYRQSKQKIENDTNYLG